MEPKQGFYVADPDLLKRFTTLPLNNNNNVTEICKSNETKEPYIPMMVDKLRHNMISELRENSKATILDEIRETIKRGQTTNISNHGINAPHLYDLYIDDILIKEITEETYGLWDLKQTNNKLLVQFILPIEKK